MAYLEHYLLGLIEHESSWKPKAKNPKSSARGLGQHLDSTIKNMGYEPTNDANDPRNEPYLSIVLTADHLLEKKEKAKDWPSKGIKMYRRKHRKLSE